MSSDAETRTGAGVLGKAREFNKRVLAAFVALAIVLSCMVVGINIVTKAEDDAPAQTTILKPVDLSVRFNGQDNFTTATVPAGVVADNKDDIVFKGSVPSTAVYQKTVLVDHENNTETPVERVAKFEGKTYYSLSANDSAGTLLLATQDLVLVYAERHQVTFNKTGEGSFIPSAEEDNGNYYIWGGEDLTMQCNPAQDYYTGKIEYTIAGQGTKTVSPSNNYVKISSKNISGDVVVTIPFVHIEEYSVNDVRYMSNSKYYPELKGLNNHGGITGVTNRQQTPSAVAPGNTATFYLFSQANSTNSQRFLLNNLAINGIDVKYPKEVGQFETTPYKDGGSIKVTLLSENNKFDGETSWPNEKPRTLYKVEVFNVHEDIEVSYYFKNQYDREIIIKGLTGIEQTAYAEEDNNIALATRYYTFTQDTIYKNVYPAYYTARGFFTDINWFPSDNLVLYTVKPGYNPYTVKTEMYYDDVLAEGSIRDTERADTPLNVILTAGNGYEDAGRYNTSQRYWGYSTNTNLRNRNTSDYLKRNGIIITRTDLLLTTLNKRDEDWYAVALSQNESNNWQLYLDADPYEYHIECDLNGGSVNSSSEGYTKDGNKLISEEFTMSEGDVYTSLPNVTPTKSGKRFLGWQMVDEQGNNIAGGFYTKNAQFVIGKDTVNHAIGNKEENENQTFKFVAVWQDDATADVAPVYVSVYQEVLDNEDEPGATYVTENGKRYKQIVSSEEEQNTAQTTILLDRHEPAPADAYVLNDSLSNLEITTSATNPQTNQLSAYYDYNLVTLNVTKEVYGRPNTKAFSITVELTPNDNPVFSLQEACDLIDVDELSVDGSGLVYTKLFENGDSEIFENVPYGWTFEVSEATNPRDYTSVIRNGNTASEDNQPLSGTLTGDTNIIVENSKLNDDKNVETDKWLTKNNDGSYKLTMEAYATGQTIVDEVQNAVPTDYILILDQSGSMEASDMPTGYTSETKNWTAGEAKGKYYKAEDGNYYEVVYKNKPITTYHEITGTKYIRSLTSYDSLIDLDNWSIEAFGDYTEETSYENTALLRPTVLQETYFKDSDGAFYRVMTYSEGLTLRYHGTLYYYDAYDVRHDLGTYTYMANPVPVNSQVNIPLYTNSTVLNSGTWYNPNWQADIDVQPAYDLYYTDSEGNEHRISNSNVSDTSTPVYSGPLYTPKEPISRRDALENAAKQFVDLIEYQASAYDVDHRIAVVGFSSSSGTNNTEILSRKGPLDTEPASNYSNYTSKYFPDGVNYNGTQYSNSLQPSAYENTLLSPADPSEAEYLNNAIEGITACGGTEPAYGFFLADGILTNRDATFTTSAGTEANRNAVVIFFTDGAPGNYSYSDQIEEANRTVVASKAVKDKGATVYSIGVFDKGDDLPLTYTSQNDPGQNPAANYLSQSGGYFYYRGNSTASSEYNDTIADYMLAVSSKYPSATGFYTKGNLTPSSGAAVRGTATNDNVQYYARVADGLGMTNAFDYISEQAGPTVVTTTLGPSDSALRDYISEDFDLTEGYSVTAYTSNAIYDNEDNLTGWANKVAAQGVVIDPIGNDRMLNVRNYDYASHYVSPDNKANAQKIIVEIDGVKPKPDKTGGVFASNTGDSGIYKLNNDSDKLIDAFPIPEISRYKYTVLVEEENETAKFGVDFKMSASDWENGVPIATDNNGTVLTFSLTDGSATETWKQNNSSTGAQDEDYIIFEEILETENNSGVKHNDTIPDNYTLSTAVMNPDNSGDYEYTLFIDGVEQANFSDGTTFVELPQRDADIVITSRLVTQQVMIRKLTRTEGSEDDYADWNRKFDIKVQLLDREGHDTTSAVYDDVTFDANGIATIPLAHNEMKLFNIPNNYQLVITEENQEPYVTSYLLNDDEDEVTEEALEIASVTAGTSVIVYNTIQAPVITGISDNESSYTFILYIVAGVSIASAVAYVIWRRKKITE